MELPTVPRFLYDLRAALATLYQTNNNNTPSKEAHDYCLFVQSRNARRKIRSWQQQQQDQPSGALPSAEFVFGSSWLACLALLLQNNNNNVSHTERLFCAQSLLHRIRRVSIAEAVDWELEDASTAMPPAPPAAVLLEAYRDWMRRINPTVAHCIEKYHSAETEERVKGELTLLTIASILHHHEVSENNTADPLCTTLASILATTAVRLRFSDASSTSLIVWIRHAFMGVTQQPNSLAFSLTLIAIPETVFTNAAGNRLSIDPKCIQIAIQELQTVELPLLFQCLPADELWVLRLGEAWARFLPLPEDFIRQTAPLMIKHWNSKVALKYWLAIMESAALTMDEIVTQRLGLADGQQQMTKKRLSARSKKKKQAKVEQDSTDEMYSEAEWEVRHRGAMACTMVLLAWSSFHHLVKDCLLIQSHHHQVDGEGPLGCLAACANACLPYILRYRETTHGTELFRVVAEGFQELCSHPNASVRALSLEPIHNLHAALLESVRTHGPLSEPLESFVVDHFSKCTISLASVCAYPPDYFHNKTAQSDEDFEILRNDVRDIIRTVSGSGESGSTSDAVSLHGPIPTTLKILSGILNSCHQAVVSAKESGELLPEPAVHTLSALAKPLNFVAKFFVQTRGEADIQRLLEFAFSFLCRVCNMVVDLFHVGARLEDTLPRCRTAAIAVASLSPMISCMSILNILDGKALSAILDMATLSIEHLPELFGESTLKHSLYDIRGTMRGPGGEDHVGCLALMRMTKESEALTNLIISVHAETFVPRLCRLHQLLKAIENERGVGPSHGKGVTPTSRRILLGILSHLEVTSKGQAGASSLLEELFNHAIHSIAQFASGFSFDERTVFQITEHTFDLASFSPSILVTLFTSNESSSSNVKTACLECLTSSCIAGYNQLSSPDQTSTAIMQWNRFRAALFQLYRIVLKIDTSQRGAEMIRACALAELEAIHRQCQLGKDSGSSLFLDDIISEDSIPAGIFFRVVGENLFVDGVLNQACLFVLMECRQAALSVVTHPCSDPISFVDPRPALLEAWLFSMTELANNREHAGESLLIDTFVASITLIFMSSLGKTEDERRRDPGMSMDGPHSLMMTMFLIRFFELGPQILKAAAERLVEVIPIDPSSSSGLSDSLPFYQGMAIIGASLFRAAQGSLPPWVVEMCPEIYSSLYSAMGKNSNDFFLLFRWSMELRLSSRVSHFGGVLTGKLLSGHCFEKLNDKAKLDFLNQATELAAKDDATSWRRMKVLIKQVSGGKKKDTDFRQKPSLTRWEFVRL